jgi:hypothetical protein
VPEAGRATAILNHPIIACRLFSLPLLGGVFGLWGNWRWLDPDHNRMYFMSASIILFQVILGALLIVVQRAHPSSLFPQEKTAPFLAASLVLFLSGLRKYILAEV